MPTRGHEGHEMVKIEGVPQGTPSHKRDDEHPGYEIQDVNVSGIVTFLAGLSGFIIVFFFFCWIMGKGINSLLVSQDAKPSKWQTNMSEPGAALHGEKTHDLTSDAAMEQAQLQQMTTAFPTPRLEADDGNQDLADLHAREDLLLSFYSTSGDQAGGAIRIPIDRAMALVVQRGLGTPAAAQGAKPLMAGEAAPVLQAPLTDGFARTGFELETMEARQQRLEFGKAEKAEK